MKNSIKFNNHLKRKRELNIKFYLSITLILALTSTVLAQNGRGFGVKAGVSYNTNGDYYNSVDNAYHNPTQAIGYHIGIFGKLGNRLYVKPELVYTRTNSEYNTGDFTLQRIDAPVLAGLKIIGPVSIFAGPAFQYIIDSSFENATIGAIENEFSVGLNFGIGLNFDSIGIDLRYERSFTENEATILFNDSTLNIDRLDTRTSQLILSLSVKL